jgi:hypothetical protein
MIGAGGVNFALVKPMIRIGNPWPPPDLGRGKAYSSALNRERGTVRREAGKV